MISIFSFTTSENSNINIECQFVGLVLVYYLRQEKFKFIKNKRINVHVYSPESNSESSQEYSVKIPSLNSSIPRIIIYRSFESYNLLSDHNKRIWQLENSILGLKELFKYKSWDVRLLNDLFDELKYKLDGIELNLFQKEFYNKRKTKKVILRLRPEFYKITFIAYCHNLEDGTVTGIPFFEGIPNYHYWGQLFSEKKWESDSAFKIFDDTETFSFLIDTEQKTSSISQESVASIEKIMDYLGDFSANSQKWKDIVEGKTGNY